MKAEEIVEPFGTGAFLAGKEALHLAGVRREEARTATVAKKGDVVREGVEGIGIDDHGLAGIAHEGEDFVALGGAEAGTGGEDVGGFVEDFAKGANFLHHDLGDAGGGEDGADAAFDIESDEAASGLHGGGAGEAGGSREIGGTGDDADAAVFSLMRLEGTEGQP